MTTETSAPQGVNIRITVNGREQRGHCEPRKLLCDFLREDLCLTGTHVGCEHGICGACTVMIDGQAGRSCTTLAVQADGCEIQTIEGLADGDVLHPLQEAFRTHHGLQCGFCTPGMLMVAHDLLRTNPDPDDRIPMKKKCAKRCPPPCAAAPVTRASWTPCSPSPRRACTATGSKELFQPGLRQRPISSQLKGFP
jgi:aerobic-type carbon monoxide dehydrogenase small subunit (CoxS/CutS family)